MNWQIGKILLKYFDYNKNQKMDWWEYLNFVIHIIVFLLFFIGFVIWLLE